MKKMCFLMTCLMLMMVHVVKAEGILTKLTIDMNGFGLGKKASLHGNGMSLVVDTDEDKMARFEFPLSEPAYFTLTIASSENRIYLTPGKELLVTLQPDLKVIDEKERKIFESRRISNLFNKKEKDDDLLLSVKIVYNEEYVNSFKRTYLEKYLNEQLYRLKTDYLDYYFLHSLNKETFDFLKTINISSFLDKIKEKIKNKLLTCEEVVKAYIEQINKFSSHNAVLEVFSDAIEKAQEMDKKIAEGFDGKLAGVPILIKDNILYQGKKACCGSKFLSNYIAQYNSTAVQKALDAGAVIIGRTNMDEFGMGSSTENSAFGVTHNPIDFNRVAGGSSGGSACAVALNMSPIALGTDTGGSSRQPASYCGVVGLKPSYGRISRYGIVAYGSSLDQVGIMTNSVEDNALMLEVLAGEDIHDETTQKTAVPEYSKNLNLNPTTIKVGVVKEILETIKGMECENNIQNFINELKTVEKKEKKF